MNLIVHCLQCIGFHLTKKFKSIFENRQLFHYGFKRNSISLVSESLYLIYFSSSCQVQTCRTGTAGSEILREMEAQYCTYNFSAISLDGWMFGVSLQKWKYCTPFFSHNSFPLWKVENSITLWSIYYEYSQFDHLSTSRFLTTVSKNVCQRKRQFFTFCTITYIAMYSKWSNLISYFVYSKICTMWLAKMIQLQLKPIVSIYYNGVLTT